LCPNVYLDSSSSNGWMRYTPGLTLEQVFKTTVAVIGPDRLLFGTDSSFFPRGWNHAVYESQLEALTTAGINDTDRARILGGAFDKLFQ
jgi:predicted TIM-barrel fold metal-dependent hydrolase